MRAAPTVCSMVRRCGEPGSTCLGRRLRGSMPRKSTARVAAAATQATAKNMTRQPCTQWPSFGCPAGFPGTGSLRAHALGQNLLSA